MAGPKKAHPKEKRSLHQRNKHRTRYNFSQLIKACPELKPFVKLNEYRDESIDFFDPSAVKMLNKALLMHFYGLTYWDIPEGYLCPPIPGRADYIHYIADLLSENCKMDKSKRLENVWCLDIGVGANCVYPIIGAKEYKWRFVGSDIEEASLKSALKIVEMNAGLKEKVELRKQGSVNQIFNGLISEGEKFDLTICNPPFHASKKEAQAISEKKARNLKQKKVQKTVLNFGGQHNELWCTGGEKEFVRKMILESKDFANSCLWFTTLVSKKDNMSFLLKVLNEVGVSDVKTIQMGQGNKISRILAWTFLSKREIRAWKNDRFGIQQEQINYQL